MKTDYGIYRQESSKELFVNYEIRFTRAYNQLANTKINSNCKFLGIEIISFLTRLADFMSNIDTPSRDKWTFLNQISFHAKFTSQRRNIK